MRAWGAAIAALVLGVSAARAAERLPREDGEDLAFATRGYIAGPQEAQIRSAAGGIVWDFTRLQDWSGPAPATVHPSLWRHAGLLSKHGLFKVHERIHQVRGFDVSNMTVITGETGYILVDPLTATETAAAAFALVKKHLGDRPVVALIYTHSHGDHFGGAKGVVDPAAVAAGKVRVYAPEGFLEHAVSENIIAGPAMTRRASYQFGAGLPSGPEGAMTSGIGPALPQGTFSLIPPTDSITKTGEERLIDGVRFIFQMTPGTEAPAEMNFFLPEFKALCLAENANASLHNVLTPRGALVRDAKVWADGLTESDRLFGASTDILFTSHFWPRFGAAVIRDYIQSHRDAYKFLHDQSVRLMNKGYTAPEIAEMIVLPESLSGRWFNRGYYGTMRHNARAVYQRYLGWYDAHPASLDALPPEDVAKRYVAAMGGEARAMKSLRAAVKAEDHRWAAELGRHLVFANPANEEARKLQAQAFRALAHKAESAIWRNIYLVGARELESGVAAGGPQTINLEVVAQTPTPMLLDLMAVRLDPAKAGERRLSINLVFPDRSERHSLRVANGVLVHEQGVTDPKAALTLTGPRAVFLGAALAGQDLTVAAGAGLVKLEGDAQALAALASMLDGAAGGFPIVTP